MSATLEYPQKHPITAEEYLRMGAAGVFAPGARLELIEGEIVEMAPIEPPHAGLVKQLNWLFGQRAGRVRITTGARTLVKSGQRLATIVLPEVFVEVGELFAA